MGLGRTNTIGGFLSLEESKSKISDRLAAERLMTAVKDSIMSETHRALSVYANLKKSGKHIVWVPD